MERGVYQKVSILRLVNVFRLLIAPYQEEVLTYILVTPGSSFTYSIDGGLSEE